MEAKKVARMLNPTKVITGPRTRWSYANVWDPKSINGGDPKYSVSLIIPKSSGVTARPFPRFQSLRHRSATATGRDRTMRLTGTAISSTPTALPSLGSWMRTETPSWIVRKCIPVCTAGHPSTSTHSTPTATKVLPAA